MAKLYEMRSKRVREWRVASVAVTCLLQLQRSACLEVRRSVIRQIRFGAFEGVYGPLQLPPGRQAIRRDAKNGA